MLKVNSRFDIFDNTRFNNHDDLCKKLNISPATSWLMLKPNLDG